MASPSTNTYISSTRLSAGPFSGSRGAYANSPKTVSFDVTSAAEAWYEGTSPNYGIALKYEGGTNSSVILKSCEAGSLYRAYYIITYTEPEIVSGVCDGHTTGCSAHDRIPQQQYPFGRLFGLFARRPSGPCRFRGGTEIPCLQRSAGRRPFFGAADADAGGGRSRGQEDDRPDRNPGPDHRAGRYSPASG